MGSSDFRGIIKSHCSQIGWNIQEIDDKKAKMSFSMDSGRTQILFILNYDPVLEFSVPSSAVFNSGDEIPHELSSILLWGNSTYNIGAWCIEKIGEKLVYSVMHNCEMRMLDRNYFERIVFKLISECDEFEGTLAQLLSATEQRSSPPSRRSSDSGRVNVQEATGGINWGRIAQMGLETLVTTFIRDEVNSMFDRDRRY